MPTESTYRIYRIKTVEASRHPAPSFAAEQMGYDAADALQRYAARRPQYVPAGEQFFVLRVSGCLIGAGRLLELRLPKAALEAVPVSL